MIHPIQNVIVDAYERFALNQSNTHISSVLLFYSCKVQVDENRREILFKEYFTRRLELSSINCFYKF